MNLRQWGAFAGLGVIWGSSFLWIKIALEEVGPFTLVAYRLMLGLLALLLIMLIKRLPFPLTRQNALAFLFMGTLNTTIPFSLISWGETSIPSGVASILNGTVPLFTLIIAHLWLHDEKITLGRAAGLLLGFTGVVVLMSKNIKADQGFGSLWGQLAVLLAACLYAIAATFSRRHLRDVTPLTQASLSLFAGACVHMPFLTILRHTAPLVDANGHGGPGLIFPSHPMSWVALLWLGILGSGIAYLLFFYLISSWGPARASLVTYVFPVAGLILGILFLNEAPDLRLAIGALLIVGGIVVVKRA